MIKISNMYKSYSSKYTGKQEVFKDFSIDFPSKGFVSILGKSGCGKTTLLNVIGGIDSIDKGYVNVFGYDISKYSNGNTLIDEYRKDIVGFVFQSYNLINNISVYKNLALPLEMQGYSSEEIKVKIEEVLTKVEMIEYKNRMPYELSGGQQQRVSIARALIKKSKVVLADEPTGNLDSATAIEILKLLKEISKDRLVIFITHDQEYADTYSDEVVQIKDGKITNDYKMSVEKNDKDIKKAKSKVGLKSIFKNSFENIKLNLVKSILIVLLFSVTLTIISSSIILLTTSKNEIFVDVMRLNDDELSTRIVSAEIIKTENGEIVPSFSSEYSNHYEIYDEFLNLQEEFGSENVILSSRIVLSNWYNAEGEPIFDHGEMLYDLRMNFLEADFEYNIPNLVGRLPKNDNEVIISDLLAFLLFDKDDALGEKIEITKHYAPITMVDAELTVVGIITTGYLDDGYLSDNEYYNYHSYRGDASVPDSSYHFDEVDVHKQLYGLKSMFEDLDNYYVFPRVFGSLQGVNFQIMVDGIPKYLNRKIINSRYIDPGTLLGRLPKNDSEACVDIDRLSVYYPEFLNTFNDLKNGSITWDDFVLMIDLSDINVFFGSQLDERHYENIIPSSLTIVGVYEPIDNMSILLTDDMLIKLNNAFPYEDVGISFVNTSPNLEDQLDYVTSDSFNEMFLNYNIYYDREVIINSEGSFNLYRILDNVENTVIPLARSILIGTTLFTFILMFLFSYLSIMNAQKRIGIFRSLGYGRNDILKMYILENNFILLASLFLGGLASIYALIKLNQSIFAETKIGRAHV